MGLVLGQTPLPPSRRVFCAPATSGRCVVRNRSAWDGRFPRPGESLGLSPEARPPKPITCRQSPGWQAAPHPADATGRNLGPRGGARLPSPIGGLGCHLRLAPPFTPGPVTTASDVPDVTQRWREGAGVARGGPGAISKCATRDAGPAQGLTSRRLLPVAPGDRPQVPARGLAAAPTRCLPSARASGAPWAGPAPRSPTRARGLSRAYRKSGGSG